MGKKIIVPIVLVAGAFLIQHNRAALTEPGDITNPVYGETRLSIGPSDGSLDIVMLTKAADASDCKAQTERIEREIRSGSFAKELAAEVAAGRPTILRETARAAAHPMEAHRVDSRGIYSTGQAADSTTHTAHSETTATTTARSSSAEFPPSALPHRPRWISLARRR